MSKLINYNSILETDLEKLGLKCGIEIHQQLNTGKLFCSCPCEIVPNEKLNKSVERKLRFSQSESGQVDIAALNEFKKGKYNRYLYNDKISCLVDLDEQPPKGPNKKALETSFLISKMLNLKIFSKLIFMRKLIVDGSIITGYQRTAMIGVDGWVDTNFGKVGINGINLEEDSARNIEKKDSVNIYSLDRQGIPLIELTTAPDVRTPKQAKELANRLGDILRSLKYVKRGLGTIRQDLNVSIRGGARVEIKGAQNLKLIDKIVEDEMRRQAVMISIKEELEQRGITKENFSDFKIYDISDIFKNTQSKVVLSNLEKENNGGVFAIKLNGFKQILGCEIAKNYRFATEVSNKNKAHFPKIKGLFHLDELPKYGIEQKEVDEIKHKLNLKDLDSFILIVSNKDLAEKSLKFILDIIKELINGPIEEVRQVDPKGTLTTPLRAMPGSARMYPETDIEEIEVDFNLIDNLKIPELYSKKIKRLSEIFGVEEEKVEEILSYFNEEQYLNLLKIGLKPSQIYSYIFEIPKEIKKKEKLEIYNFNINFYTNLLNKIKKGDLNKNIVYDLYLIMFKNNLKDIDNFDKFLSENNLVSNIDENEIEEILKKIIKENKGAPFGALMGHAMKAFKGKVDGKVLSLKIKKLLEN